MIKMMIFKKLQLIHSKKRIEQIIIRPQGCWEALGTLWSKFFQAHATRGTFSRGISEGNNIKIKAKKGETIRNN